MKKFFSLLLLLLCTNITILAQDVMWIDHCNAEYDATARSIEGSGDIDVAIFIPKEQLKRYVGSEVSQVSMAFPTTHPTTMKMWLRKDRDGENLREIDVERIVSKWNVYNLEIPLPVTGDEGLWLGATFNQRSATVKYLSMAGTAVTDGCHYRIAGGAWLNKASEQLGSFCMRLGLTGDNLPHHDMQISDLSVERSIYAIGTSIPVTLRISNHGVDEVVNPIIRSSIDGVVMADTKVTATIPCGGSVAATVKVPTSSLTEGGNVTLGLEALWSDDKEDLHPVDNKSDLNLSLVVPHRNIALTNVSTNLPFYRQGANIIIQGTILNKDYTVVQNPQIIYTVNGGEAKKKAITCKLDYNESQEFSLPIPTADVEVGDVTVDLQLAWRDGGEDDAPADNKFSFDSKIVSLKGYRRMVVEEVTGDWCQWCVRGIVGLRDMKAQFPDHFIGIAVHYGDVMENEAYKTWFESMPMRGLPSCFINRERVSRDPRFSDLNNYFHADETPAAAEVELEATYSKTAFDVTATVIPTDSSNNKNYRVLFVVVENGIVGTQMNAYANNANGEMGGWEKLGGSVATQFNDVARGIFPNPTGLGHQETALPAVLVKDQSYTVQYNIPFDSMKISKTRNCEVIALLIDDRTSEIVNAAKTNPVTTGIDTVLRPEEPSSSYNLSGQRVNDNAHGIIITEGRKTIR